MSKKLTIVAASRDDAYGDDPHDGIYDLKFTPLKNIERTKISIEKNLDLFKKNLDFDFEYIVVDWSPIENKYLFKNTNLENILTDSDVKNIIVSPQSVEKIGLNPNGFYEYFAKNVGVRNSVGEFILIINSDGLLSKKIIKEINLAIKNNEKDYYFRPHSRIDIDPNFKKLAEGPSFYESQHELTNVRKRILNDIYKLDFKLDFINRELSTNPNFYNLIGTPAAGDFTMTHRYNFIDIATGYFEDLKNIVDKNFRQTARDGQLLVNLILHGIYPKKLKNSIESFDHNKIERVGELKFRAYKNHDNWGFNNFEISQKNDNTYLI